MSDDYCVLDRRTGVGLRLLGVCPHCGGSITNPRHGAAVVQLNDWDNGRVTIKFSCEHCGGKLGVLSFPRLWTAPAESGGRGAGDDLQEIRCLIRRICEVLGISEEG